MRLTTAYAAFAALAAFVLPALGELAVTFPIDSTTCIGGQTCTVKWNDNNKPPTIASQGNCTIALYTGSRTQQTFLQPISFPQSINVTTSSSIDFTVNPAVGESGSYYFIRFSSTTLKNGANPYLSFSAIFTLSGMTGTFNQTVKNQLLNISSVSTGPTTATPQQTTTVLTAIRSSTSASRSAASASTKPANGTGAAFINASPVTYTGVAAFICAVVGLFF